jgi:hypothetical protein
MMRDDVTGDWRNVHNEALHNLYLSPNIIKQFVGKPKGKRQLGRPRHRWEDGIRMDLMEIGWGGWWIVFEWLRIETGDDLL